MPQKYTSRVIIILGIMLLAVLAILPPVSLVDTKLPWAKKIRLKPGIDMAGGTKLIYEIKTPEGGGTFRDNLAEQVMEALKKRVDPDGVKNLIWRPQGGNRLEIQMPLSSQTEQTQAIRTAYSEAQQKLDKTNIRRSDVLRAVEKLIWEERRARFTELAILSDQLLKLFGSLAAAYDAVKAADATGDPRKQAETQIVYDKFKSQIEDSNLTSTELQLALDDPKPEARKKKIAEIEARNAGFAIRLAAIEGFAKAYEDYAGVKGHLDDAGELKRLLKGAGVLEFHMLVDDADLAGPVARDMMERLKPGGKGIAPQANDEMRWYAVDRPEDMAGMRMVDYNDRKYILAWTTPEKSMVNRPGQPKWSLESAYKTNTEYGIYAVGFRFDNVGAARFGELTQMNLKHQMAVMLDDKVISAATIQAVINKEGIISRDKGYSDDELRYLIATLNAGSLPAQLADEPISEQTVGPQLGEDNLRNGLFSCIFGLVVIGVFLIGYYHLAGVVAFVAVLMDVILILGAMAAFDATFTLPGVAGIVLTICIAVDANVLVFERLREEQLRGMALRMALRNAYDRAFSAILDSNVTTAITAFILYWLGSEEVKGFGLTLLLGMLSSMFTALFVTKTVYGLMTDKLNVKKLGSLPLSMPKLNKFLHPHIDWMKMTPVFFTFSALSIGIGLWAFFAQGKKMLDIEFASGTSVQIELRGKMPIEDVRGRIEEFSRKNPDIIPSPLVVSLDAAGKNYEIVTANANGKEVKDAIIATMGDKLNVERESKFDMVGQPLDKVIHANIVQAITRDDLTIEGKSLDGAPDHLGGVAIVLNNIEPPLTVAQIKARIEKQRLQPQASGQTIPYREMDIEVLQKAPGTDAAKGGGELVKSAAILVSDAKYPYDKNPVDWNEYLAGPTWKLVNDGINNPAQLSKVTNFDAQVAGATQTKALMALALSTLVIMVYIWFRFGDMQFGSASVVATLHDAAFMIGAIGLSHYIANYAIGQWLMIEPFRLNLTMVASILTVLGYSMNDTVVVFDRIRENRGKLGRIDRQIINDSINQTFSRTMLISGTAMVMVLIMYVYGGPGIHGFTFALLIGIIEGTYSSFAIAAPVLMLGHRSQAGAASASKASTTAS